MNSSHECHNHIIVIVVDESLDPNFGLLHLSL